MARRLATTVHVEDENGEYHVFGPGDNVPAELAKRITNPGVWEAEKDDESDEATPRTGRRRATS